MTSSDWFAVSQLHSNHHIAESEGDAGVQAFNAGLDIETPNASGFAALAEAVQAGKVSELSPVSSPSSASMMAVLKFDRADADAAGRPRRFSTRARNPAAGRPRRARCGPGQGVPAKASNPAHSVAVLIGSALKQTDEKAPCHEGAQP